MYAGPHAEWRDKARSGAIEQQSVQIARSRKPLRLDAPRRIAVNRAASSTAFIHRN
jgi:hypothetical protein